MNVQIEVDGQGKVDFVSPYGWVRNPRIELCGIDDADLCEKNVGKYFASLSAVPFENLAINEQFMDAANKELHDAVDAYQKTGKTIIFSDVISIVIRPVPKASRESTPEEVAAAMDQMGDA